MKGEEEGDGSGRIGRTIDVKAKHDFCDVEAAASMNDRSTILFLKPPAPG